MTGLSGNFLFTFSMDHAEGYVEVHCCAWCGAAIAESGRGSTTCREQHLRAGCNPNGTDMKLVLKS